MQASRVCSENSVKALLACKSPRRADEALRQIAVESRRSLRLVAREEVSIEVEGDGDRAVAHVAAQSVGVDACGDAHARVEVAARVERDAGQAAALPGVVGAVLEATSVEWAA